MTKQAKADKQDTKALFENVPREAKMAAFLAALLGTVILTVEVGAVSILMEMTAFASWSIASYHREIYGLTLLATLFFGYRFLRSGYRSELILSGLTDRKGDSGQSS